MRGGGGGLKIQTVLSHIRFAAMRNTISLSGKEEEMQKKMSVLGKRQMYMRKKQKSLPCPLLLIAGHRH